LSAFNETDSIAARLARLERRVDRIATLAIATTSGALGLAAGYGVEHYGGPSFFGWGGPAVLVCVASAAIVATTLLKSDQREAEGQRK
jgi:peptidoglycan/LPS O-acetylase OafA/YrhL